MLLHITVKGSLWSFFKPLVALQSHFSKCEPVVLILCTHKSTHALNEVIEVMQHTALQVLELHSIYLIVAVICQDMHQGRRMQASKQ